jgi:hypothetical protein
LVRVGRRRRAKVEEYGRRRAKGRRGGEEGRGDFWLLVGYRPKDEMEGQFSVPVQ